ncbi:hypothetical protein ANME2D_02484 [Candidatus Methanoperedens nitroreducens]|uniref:Ternary complex associated domain-containing protein n=1 Tax=Candidatus Methanoperedens nitratireducens TaxID=1392998 RepID=A0A062V1N2_9EURY|nr:hypothetical protein ANME2D_02484 [Candidatus Methanoperedens nitroreducens]
MKNSGLHLELEINILNKNEEILIKRVSKEIYKKGNFKVILQPLERIGKRKTKLFIAYYINKDNRTRSRVFVLKIADKKYISRDYDGWEKNLKHNIRTQLYPPKYEGRIGALILNHAGAFTIQDIDKSKELDEVLFSDVLSVNKKLEIFKKLYEDELENLNEGRTIQRCSSLLKEYEWYLRGNKSEKLICSWLGSSDIEYIKFFGVEVINPLKFMKDFGGFSQQTKITVKNIHGDLHPKNVIVNKNLEPRLIDFEWANKKHALKDYVLMEASIKFFQMSRTLPLTQCMKFEKQLVDFKNFEEIEALFPIDKDRFFLEAYRIIWYIRKKAMEFCIWKNKKAEYLSSLFLVSHGLLHFPECNSLYCLGSLGLIAEKLQGCNLEDLKPK